MNTNLARTVTRKPAGASRAARTGTVVAGPPALASGAFSSLARGNAWKSEKTSREMEKISREDDFISREKKFISREDGFISREKKFIPREDGFIPREKKFISREDAPVSREKKFISREVFPAFRARTKKRLTLNI
jgi:hypothetical protein